jgi:hypothetical protein
MRAADHTQQMLDGWLVIQVCGADLAVRRSDGTMLWRLDQPLERLPLGWARAENAHGAEIYIRPARGFDWPLVFLDDLPVPVAQQLAQAYGAMVIQTSPAGGCHVWLPCDRSLDEGARLQAQRGLAARFGADKGSISGEHLGRLAGFKNWKRSGCWLRCLARLTTLLQSKYLGTRGSQHFNRGKPAVRRRGPSHRGHGHAAEELSVVMPWRSRSSR